MSSATRRHSALVPVPLREDEPYIGTAVDYLETHGFRLRILSDPAGTSAFPGGPNAVVAVHVGPSVDVACTRGGARHRGIAVHGDIDIIPPDTPSVWVNGARDTVLALSLAPGRLAAVAEELDVDPRGVEIRNRFQIRDPQLEHIAWALKAEIDAGFPCGRLYLDSLATAVGVRLVRAYSSVARFERAARLGDRRLRQVLSYIEANIGEDLALADLADVAGLSVSHFTTVFRDSVGASAHQYVIRRRVERARALIAAGELPLSRIAAETGFAHQSHLARQMRRVLGVTPAAVRSAGR